MHEVHLNGRWLGQPFTGVQRYSEELASRLVADDGISFVLHVPKGAHAPKWAVRDHVEIRRAPVGGIAYEQIYLPLATREKLLLSFGGIPPVVKRKQMVTFHDATPFRHPRTFRLLFVAYYFVGFFLLSRMARWRITVSHFSRAELAEILRIDPSGITVVPCAADLGLRTSSVPAQTIPEGPFYLVVGTLAQHKNVAAPVDALVASGRTVVVVGAAGHASVFAKDVTSFGPSVTVADRLTDGELRWLYEHAQALIFPSYYEGFGLPVIEAQTLGCPVIASNSASLPEVAGSGALYFDPANTDDLIGRVDVLEADDRTRDDLVLAGLQNACRFSWQDSAERVLRLVRAACESESPRGRAT